MDSIKIQQEEMAEDNTVEITEEAEKEESQKVCRHNPIDPETLIDIIHFSSESWEDLDEELHEQRDHVKLQNYYIDLATYNRKLELLKMGYYDVFEPNDETIFQDRLAFSLETSISLRDQREAAEEIDSTIAETAVQESTPETGESGILNSITRFFFPQVCYQ
ncbi:MAG: hypothetical protein AB2L14_28820 [Candidatus Xenobiia bacterium LiM19]